MALDLNLVTAKQGLFYNPHVLRSELRVNDQNSVVHFPIDKMQDKNNRELSKIIYEIKKQEEVLMVVIPSLSLPKECLIDIKGIAHYEIRSLWHILLAKENNLRVLFLSSLEFPKEAIIHLLDASGDRKSWEHKVDFLHIEGTGSNCLSENILNSNKAYKALEKKIITGKSFLMSFIASKNEEDIAGRLNIPFYGVKEIYQFYQTKSGNREIFKEAKVSFPDGYENLKSEFEVIQAIENLKINNPDCKKMVVKLDHGVSGKGNALFKIGATASEFFKLDKTSRYALIKKQLLKMKYQIEKLDWAKFSTQLVNGSIVEIFIEGEIKHSPSCQVVIRPNGKIDILSTHEQILDESGMVFQGCIFPANNNYRKKLHSETLKVGKKLALKGVIGFFSIDFLVTENGSSFNTNIIEINLRQGGTTHPYQTVRLITESTYTSTGHLINPKGDFVFYSSNDNFVSRNLVGKDFSDLLSYMKLNKMIFNKKKCEGVTFHLSSAIKDFGKIGYIVIAKSNLKVVEIRKELDQLLLKF